MNIWNLPPIVVALILFCIDFLAVIFIRVVFEKRFYLSRWWTFIYGDSISLPLYGFFAANILHSTAIQISLWWNIAFIFLGIITMLETEFLHVEDKFYKFRQEFLPSQIYHAFIFVVMFYFVVSSLSVILTIHSLSVSFAGALFAISGYFLLVIRDYTIKKASKKSHKKRKHQITF